MSTIHSFKITINEWVINYDGFGSNRETIHECQLANSLEHVVEKTYEKSGMFMTDHEKEIAIQRLRDDKEFYKYFDDSSSIIVVLHDTLEI